MESSAIDHEKREREEVMMLIHPNEFGCISNIIAARKNAVLSKNKCSPLQHDLYEELITHLNSQLKQILGLP